MERTIRVTGRGRIAVSPDTVRLLMNITRLQPEYSAAAEAGAQAQQNLCGVLAGFGFAEQDLKTLSWNTGAEHESYQEEGAWRQRLVGYRCTHRMKLEFPLDTARLSAVLTALADCEAMPELELEFTVADVEPSRTALLEQAVKDSRRKAAALTAAAGVALGQVQSIDYSWGEVDLCVRPMAADLMRMEKAAVPDMTPEDIQLEDTVTVVWELV